MALLTTGCLVWFGVSVLKTQEVLVFTDVLLSLFADEEQSGQAIVTPKAQWESVDEPRLDLPFPAPNTVTQYASLDWITAGRR